MVRVGSWLLWKGDRMTMDVPPGERIAFMQLPRHKRYKLYGLAVVRTLLGLIGIWVFMWLVPDEAGLSIVWPMMLGVAGVAFYIWFFRRQVKMVGKSNLPGLRAAEALILVIAMFLAIFASAYVILSSNDVSSFTEPMDNFTAYYYALTVLATVGFGDITPVSTVARSISMVQMACDIAIVGVAFKVISGAATSALKKPAAPAQDVS